MFCQQERGDEEPAQREEHVDTDIPVHPGLDIGVEEDDRQNGDTPQPVQSGPVCSQHDAVQRSRPAGGPAVAANGAGSVSPASRNALTTRASDLVGRLRADQRDGRAAEAAAGHPRPEGAGGDRRVDDEVELAARHLVVVAQRGVRRQEQPAHLVEVAAPQGGRRTGGRGRSR